MLPRWIKTEKGFYIPPGQAGYSVEYVAGLCWRILATCMACGHARSWSVAAMSATFPAKATMGEIALRLVCRACGSDQGLLEFRQDHNATSARDIADCTARRGERA